MKDFLLKFALSTEESDVFLPYFETAKKRLEAEKAEIFNFEKYKCYTYMKEDLARVRDALLLDKDNLLYAYFLHEILKKRDRELLKRTSAPRAEDKNELYDTLPLFALLAEIPTMWEEQKKRGIPEDVRRDTANMFENQVQDFIDLNGHLGIKGYFFWMLRFLDLYILRVGRFNLEYTTFGENYDVFDTKSGLLMMPTEGRFHRSGQVLGSAGCADEDGAFEVTLTETEDAYIGYPVVNGVCKNEKITLKKSECKKLLSKGDAVISVHIPSGGPMTDEISTRDLARGGQIVEKCLGEVKAFVCESWLLDVQIPKLLGKETNLTRFGARYERAPIKSSGGAVYDYVFLCPKSTPVEALPEKSSFAKAVKAHMLAGGYLYGAVGVFKKSDLY